MGSRRPAGFHQPFDTMYRSEANLLQTEFYVFAMKIRKKVNMFDKMGELRLYYEIRYNN